MTIFCDLSYEWRENNVLHVCHLAREINVPALPPVGALIYAPFSGPFKVDRISLDLDDPCAGMYCVHGRFQAQKDPGAKTTSAWQQAGWLVDMDRDQKRSAAWRLR